MKLYLNEPYFCSLHLRKNGIGQTGLNPKIVIMRNQDNKYLDIENNSFVDDPVEIEMVEIQSGIYNFKLEINQYYNIPASYTLIYSVIINNTKYTNSEVVYFENKNRAKLV